MLNQFKGVQLVFTLAVTWCKVFGSQIQETDPSTGIKHLSGDSDYRTVKLHWDWIKSDELEALNEFQVYYCELQAWGPHRCRTKSVSDNADQNTITNNRQSKSFSTDINGLRMATTYTFEVRPVETRQKDNNGDRSSNERELDNQDLRTNKLNDNSIVLNTKGFSAKATLCLPTVSEVDVETGPYFGGRVSVENAEGKEKCSIKGDATSARDTYTLRIDHEECGSTVNETTVATFIIVQENLPILTHSTRRFLVLCTFQPDTLTVRAGINLPTGHTGSSQIESIPYENMVNEVRQQRQMRQLSPQPEVVTERPVSHFLIMVIIVMCGIFSGTAFLIRLHHKRITANDMDVDTLSITSSTMDHQFSDIESVATIGSSTDPHIKPQEGDVFTVETNSPASTLNPRTDRR